MSHSFLLCSACTAVQDTYKRRDKLQLADNIDHFFNSIDRLSDPAYIPSYDDIIRYSTASLSWLRLNSKPIWPSYFG